MYLYNTNCLLFCTEKYKPEVDNADRAFEVCILTEGLYFVLRYYYIAKVDYDAIQRFTQDKIA